MYDEETPKPPESKKPPFHRRPPHLERKRIRIIVKGYMRPDGSTYHVVIPKQIREMMRLEGGEHFMIEASPRRSMIHLKKVEFSMEDFDEESKK
ncbi:MAG: hypothetical protein ACFE89_09640 [Candidatus Hodarchaeota archaeon]